MVRKDEQTKIKLLVQDTIRLLLKSGLCYNVDLKFEGIIGVTLDQNDVFLISLQETIQSDRPQKRYDDDNKSTDDIEEENVASVPRRSKASKRRFNTSSDGNIDLTMDCHAEESRPAQNNSVNYSPHRTLVRVKQRRINSPARNSTFSPQTYPEVDVQVKQEPKTEFGSESLEFIDNSDQLSLLAADSGFPNELLPGEDGNSAASFAVGGHDDTASVMGDGSAVIGDCQLSDVLPKSLAKQQILVKRGIPKPEEASSVYIPIVRGLPLTDNDVKAHMLATAGPVMCARAVKQYGHTCLRRIPAAQMNGIFHVLAEEGWGETVHVRNIVWFAKLDPSCLPNSPVRDSPLFGAVLSEWLYEERFSCPSRFVAKFSPSSYEGLIAALRTELREEYMQKVIGALNYCSPQECGSLAQDTSDIPPLWTDSRQDMPIFLTPTLHADTASADADTDLNGKSLS